MTQREILKSGTSRDQERMETGEISVSKLSSCSKDSPKSNKLFLRVQTKALIALGRISDL